MAATVTATRHPHYTRWPLVEGYAERQSVEPGQPVPVRVASRSGTFAVEVTRIGAQREVVWRRTGLRAADHPVPDEAWAVGCDWPVAFEIPTERSWPSGFYEIRFLADDADDADDSGDGGDPARTASEAFVVLRAPARRTGATGGDRRAVLVLSTNTWQAYNQWGGRCLYSGADRVSFARPLERGYLRRPAAPGEVAFDGRITDTDPGGDPRHHRLQDYQRTGRYPLWSASAGWHNWERRFARWAEGAGFALDYAVNADLDDQATADRVLGRADLLVSAGHDEYWSWPMRDAVDGWVDGGGNWAIFAGNTSFWQVRYEEAGRTMVCHKGSARTRDPVRGTGDAHLLTSMWSDPRIGRPETSSIGLTFSRGGYHRIGHAVAGGSGAYTVHRPDHWALAGTGLGPGDELGGRSLAVGYEVDGCAFELVGGAPVPTGVDGAPAGLEIIATAPARLISITEDRCEAPAALWASVDPPGDLEGTAMILFGRDWRRRVDELARGHAVMASFRRGRGTVFNAGSADWAYGLDGDPLVQSVTANVLRRLLDRPPPAGH